MIPKIKKKKEFFLKFLFSMVIQVILFLLGAVPHIMSPLITSLKESIELADINALIKSENTLLLKSLFNVHSEILKSPATKSYRNEALDHLQ